MFAFRVGWIEVVSKWCARSMPQSTERSHPRRASGLDAFRCADVQRRFVCCPYAIAASRKGVLVRYMACRVTASFRANATLALRGPVRSAIALAQPGTWLAGMLSRKPPMLVRVALANKMARIVWALMARDGVYQSPAAAA